MQRMKEEIYRHVIAFDELTAALAGSHPRRDVNSMFISTENEIFNIYSSTRRIVYQDPTDHYHGTEF